MLNVCSINVYNNIVNVEIVHYTKSSTHKYALFNLPSISNLI